MRLLTWLTTCLLLGLQGCASWRVSEAPLKPGGANTVPPAAEVGAPKPAPIGENRIARYGGDIGAQPSGGTVTPVISLMPVALPHYGPPGMAGPQPRHGFYPLPPPPPGYAAYEPYGDAVGRAGLGGSGNSCAQPHGGTFVGAAVGAILGNQIGDGSGRTAATAIGTVLGALAGTQAGATAPGCR